MNKATPTRAVALIAQFDRKPATTGDMVLAKYVGGTYTSESEGSVLVSVGIGLGSGVPADRLTDAAEISCGNRTYVSVNA
ncbi:hypothetical protein ACQP0C_32740 [Nocardia sp. CA-129566]|uniref:hypothetical protein n=1 Tax=Nocardia sp. CA-129566 TaxID=3239976 RepID=UPI003D98A000